MSNFFTTAGSPGVYPSSLTQQPWYSMRSTRSHPNTKPGVSTSRFHTADRGQKTKNAPRASLPRGLWCLPYSASPLASEVTKIKICDKLCSPVRRAGGRGGGGWEGHDGYHCCFDGHDCLTFELLPMLFCAKSLESMAARLDRTWPANASWISNTSMSSRVRPASSSTCRTHTQDTPENENKMAKAKAYGTQV